MPLFFQISYLLVPKIKICLKYFLDKNFQKQQLWKRRKRGSRLHEIGAAEHMADKKLVKLQGEQLLRDHVRLTWASAIFIDDHRAHLLWKRVRFAFFFS